jgi:hypothetical protein
MYGFYFAIVVTKNPKAMIFKIASIMKMTVQILSRVFTLTIVELLASFVGDSISSRITLMNITHDIV